jgi:hypothetical protein
LRMPAVYVAVGRIEDLQESPREGPEYVPEPSFSASAKYPSPPIARTCGHGIEPRAERDSAGIPESQALRGRRALSSCGSRPYCCMADIGDTCRSRPTLASLMRHFAEAFHNAMSRGRQLTYVVDENCIRCKIMDCVEVCPVDCFYEG